MADKTLTLQRKVDLLNRLIIRQSTSRFLITLLEGEKTWKELVELRAKSQDKITYFLAITEKTMDENNIVRYRLTEKGRKLATALKNLYDVLDEILPEGK